MRAVRSGSASAAASALPLVCCCAGSNGAPDGGVHFHFAQVTDTHVGDADGEARTQEVVPAQDALSLPLACVVHTGDLAEGGASEDAAKSNLALLTVPLHVFPGNHDITDDASAQAFIGTGGERSRRARNTRSGWSSSRTSSVLHEVQCPVFFLEGSADNPYRRADGWLGYLVMQKNGQRVRHLEVEGGEHGLFNKGAERNRAVLDFIRSSDGEETVNGDGRGSAT